MKLQISFDETQLSQNIEEARAIAQFADIIEIGTLPILKWGTKAVEAFREEFPDKTLMADCKIVDRGRDAASIFAQAGADWVSVMAGTSKETIHGVCSKAHDMGKKVILDIIDANSPGQAALEAKSLGVDAIMFHQPYDTNETILFLEKWTMVRGNTDLPIFVSAKIDRNNIDYIVALKPDGIIIGKGVLGQENPVAEAQFFYDKCRK